MLEILEEKKLQNYRCTGNILKAANAVIKHNENKYDKKLWTQNEEGKTPCKYGNDNIGDYRKCCVNRISFRLIT